MEQSKASENTGSGVKILSPKSWLLLLLPLQPLLPRNIICMQCNGQCLQLKGVQMSKYSAAALSKVFLAMPILWDFLVRLFEKAVSFKSRGLVASEQSQSAFVYGGIYTLSFAVFWHLSFVPLLRLNFRLGGKLFYVAQQAWVSFIFFSEQTNKKASTCTTRLLFFSTANEDKKFWKDKGLCDKGPMWRFTLLIFCSCPNYLLKMCIFAIALLTVSPLS